MAILIHSLQVLIIVKDLIIVYIETLTVYTSTLSHTSIVFSVITRNEFTLSTTKFCKIHLINNLKPRDSIKIIRRFDFEDAFFKKKKKPAQLWFVPLEMERKDRQ